MREVVLEFMGGNHAPRRLNAPAAIFSPRWAVGSARSRLVAQSSKSEPGSRFGHLFLG